MSSRGAISVPEKLDIYNVKQEACDLERLIDTSIIRKDGGSETTISRITDGTQRSRARASQSSRRRNLSASPRSLSGTPISLTGSPKSLIGSPKSLTGSPKSILASPKSLIGSPRSPRRSQGSLAKPDGSPRKELTTRQAILEEDSGGSDIRIDKDKIVIKINLKNLKKKRKKSKRKKYKKGLVKKSKKVFSKVSVNIENNVNCSLTEQDSSTSSSQSIGNDSDAVPNDNSITPLAHGQNCQTPDGIVRINSGVVVHNRYTLRNPARVSEVSSQLSQKILELTHEKLHQNYSNSLLSMGNSHFSSTNTSQNAFDPNALSLQSQVISAKTRFAKLQNYRSIREMLQHSLVDYGSSSSRLKYLQDKCNNNFQSNLNQSRSYEEVDLTDDVEPVADDEFIDINELQAFIPYEAYLKQVGDGSQIKTTKPTKVTATFSSKQMEMSVVSKQMDTCVPNLIRIDKNVCEIRDIIPSDLNPPVDSRLQNAVHQTDSARSGTKNKVLTSPLLRSQTKNTSNKKNGGDFLLQTVSSPIDNKKCTRSVDDSTSNNSTVDSNEKTTLIENKTTKPNSQNVEVQIISSQLESVLAIPKFVPSERKKSCTRQSVEVIKKESTDTAQIIPGHFTIPSDLDFIENRKVVSSRKTEQPDIISPKKQDDVQNKSSPIKTSLRSFRKDDGDKNQYYEDPTDIPTKIVKETASIKRTRDVSAEEISPTNSANPEQREGKSKPHQVSNPNKQLSPKTWNIPFAKPAHSNLANSMNSEERSEETIDRISPIMLSEIMNKLQLEAASGHEHLSLSKDLLNKVDPTIHGKSSNASPNKTDAKQDHLLERVKISPETDIGILRADYSSPSVEFLSECPTETVSFRNASCQTSPEKLSQESSVKISEISTKNAHKHTTLEKRDEGKTKTIDSSPQDTLFEALNLFKDQNHLPRSKMRKQDVVNNLLEELEKLDSNEGKDSGSNGTTDYATESLDHEVNFSKRTTDETANSLENVLKDLRKSISNVPNESKISVFSKPRKSDRIRKLKESTPEELEEIGIIDLIPLQKVDANDDTFERDYTKKAKSKKKEKDSPEKVMCNNSDNAKQSSTINVNMKVIYKKKSVESVDKDSECVSKEGPKSSLKFDPENISENNDLVKNTKHDNAKSSLLNKTLVTAFNENGLEKEHDIPIIEETSTKLRLQTERRSHRLRKYGLLIFKKNNKKLIQKIKSKFSDTSNYDSANFEAYQMNTIFETANMENIKEPKSSSNNSDSLNTIESKKARVVEPIKKADHLNAIKDQFISNVNDEGKKTFKKKQKVKKLSKVSTKLQCLKPNNNSVQTIAEIHERPKARRELTKPRPSILIPIRRSKRNDNRKIVGDINEISIAPEEPKTNASKAIKFKSKTTTKEGLTNQIYLKPVAIRRSRRIDSIRNTDELDEIPNALEVSTNSNTNQIVIASEEPKVSKTNNTEKQLNGKEKLPMPIVVAIRKSKRKDNMNKNDDLNEISLAVNEPLSKIPKTKNTKLTKLKTTADNILSTPALETLKRSSRLSSVTSSISRKSEDTSMALDRVQPTETTSKSKNVTETPLKSGVKPSETTSKSKNVTETPVKSGASTSKISHSENKSVLLDTSSTLEKAESINNVSKSEHPSEKFTQPKAPSSTISNGLPFIKTLSRSSRRSRAASTSSKKAELLGQSPLAKIVAIHKESLHTIPQSDDSNLSVVDQLIAYNKDKLRQSVGQNVAPNVKVCQEKYAEEQCNPVVITTEKSTVADEENLGKPENVFKAKRGRPRKISAIIDNVDIKRGRPKKIFKGNIVKRRQMQKKSLRLRSLRKRGTLDEENKLTKGKKKTLVKEIFLGTIDSLNNSESVPVDSISVEAKSIKIDETVPVKKRGRKNNVNTLKKKDSEVAINKLGKQYLTKNKGAALSKVSNNKHSKYMSRKRMNGEVSSSISHVNSPTMLKRIRQAALVVEKPSTTREGERNVKRKIREKVTKSTENKFAKHIIKPPKLTNLKTKDLDFFGKRVKGNDKSNEITKIETDSVRLSKEEFQTTREAIDLFVTSDSKKIDTNSMRSQTTIVDMQRAIAEQILQKKRDKIKLAHVIKPNDGSINALSGDGKKKRGRKPKANKEPKLEMQANSDLSAPQNRDSNVSVYDFQDDLETEMPSPRKLFKLEPANNFQKSYDENDEYIKTTNGNLVVDQQTSSNGDVPNNKHEDLQTTVQTQLMKPDETEINSREKNQKSKTKKIPDRHLLNIIQNIKTELKEKLSKQESKGVQSSLAKIKPVAPNITNTNLKTTPVDLSKTFQTLSANSGVIEIIVDSEQNTIDISQYSTINGESMSEDFNTALLNSIKIKKEQLQYYDFHNSQTNPLNVSVERKPKLKNLKDVTPDALLPCQLCDKIYKHPFRLKQHLKKAHTGEIFECDCCTEYFLDRIDYDAHMTSHDEGIICRLCGGKFSKPAIRDHLVLHIKEDQRVNLTEACFNRKQTCLLTHYLKKNGFKLQCHLCPDTFCPRSNVLRHYLTRHSNDKIYYSCHRCEKRFSLLQNLKRHLAIHEGITYTCGVCTRTYSRLSDYKTHVKTHVGLKFQCPVCFKCTSRPSYLKKHMIMLHGRAYSDEELNLKTSL